MKFIANIKYAYYLYLLNNSTTEIFKWASPQQQPLILQHQKSTLNKGGSSQSVQSSSQESQGWTHTHTRTHAHTHTFSIEAGQLDPVASTGISSYLSKLIPVLAPLNNSLIQQITSLLQTNSHENDLYLSTLSFLGNGLVHSSCVMYPTIKMITRNTKGIVIFIN